MAAASVSAPPAGALGGTGAGGLVGGGQLGGLGTPLQAGGPAQGPPMQGGLMQGAQVGCAAGGAGEVGEALGARGPAQRARRRSAGGEEDIFSAVGGLELDADLRAQGAPLAHYDHCIIVKVMVHVGATLLLAHSRRAKTAVWSWLAWGVRQLFMGWSRVKKTLVGRGTQGFGCHASMA